MEPSNHAATEEREIKSFGIFRRLNIRQKLLASASVALLIMAAVAGIAISGMYYTRVQFVDYVEVNEPLLELAHQLTSDVRAVQAELGLYMLSKDERHLVRYHDAQQDLEKRIAAMRALRSGFGDPGLLDELLVQIESAKESMNAPEEKMLTLVDDFGENYPAVAYSGTDVQPVTFAILQILGEMIDSELDRYEGARPEMIDLLHDARYSWMNVIAGIRGFLVFRSKQMEDTIADHKNYYRGIVEKIQEGFGDDLTFEQEDGLERITEIVSSYDERIATMIALHKGAEWRTDAVTIRTELEPAMKKMHKATNRLVLAIQDRLVQTKSNMIDRMAEIVTLVIVVLVAAGVVMLFIVYAFQRSIVDPLRQAVDATAQVAAGDLTVEPEVLSADEVGKLQESIGAMVRRLSELVARIQSSGIQLTSSTNEIAATAKQQEATVSEQAASANQIMATAKTIARTADELDNSMLDVTKRAKETARSTESGHAKLSDMEESLRNMLSATDTIGSKLQVVNEKTDNIGSVITAITKVADQTNLLSLNAAIEAEKAGEYGLGFSVVANEIRRLADQTAAATLDIERIVKEMQDAVWSGVSAVNRFTEQIEGDVKNAVQASGELANMMEQVQSLFPTFEAVHEGMHAQALSASEISEGIAQLSEAVRQSADSLAHSNRATQQLQDTARMLYESVAIFKLER